MAKKNATTAAVDEETSAASSSNTVTVAYNFPHSIIFDIEGNDGLVHSIEINGNATGLRGKTQGVLPAGGSYGLTFGVDADLWAAIEKKFGWMAIFKNGLIFATKPADASDAVADHSSVRNGFEPIDVTDKKSAATTAATE